MWSELSLSDLHLLQLFPLFTKHPEKNPQMFVFYDATFWMLRFGCYVLDATI